MKVVNSIVLALIVIGAINWGLIGLFNFNLVTYIFGDMQAISRLVFALVGIAGIWSLTFFGKLGEEEQ